ncbi:hypothetical protein ACIBJF_28070 [Streptomyces sp. NPDC050743]
MRTTTLSTHGPDADNAGGAEVQLPPASLADLDALPAPVGARY